MLFLENTMKHLLELQDSCLTATQKATLNERLLEMKRPERMALKQRSSSDRTKLKAKEFRIFLLCCLPLLEDLLPSNVISNFKLFCRARFILLSDTF